MENGKSRKLRPIVSRNPRGSDSKTKKGHKVVLSDLFLPLRHPLAFLDILGKESMVRILQKICKIFS